MSKHIFDNLKVSERKIHGVKVNGAYFKHNAANYVKDIISLIPLDAFDRSDDNEKRLLHALYSDISVGFGSGLYFLNEGIWISVDNLTILNKIWKRIDPIKKEKILDKAFISSFKNKQ